MAAVLGMEYQYKLGTSAFLEIKQRLAGLEDGQKVKTSHSREGSSYRVPPAAFLPIDSRQTN